VALNDFLPGFDSYQPARLVVVPREFHTISMHGSSSAHHAFIASKNYPFDAFQALGSFAFLSIVIFQLRRPAMSVAGIFIN
jgi:hypothetical protein